MSARRGRGRGGRGSNNRAGKNNNVGKVYQSAPVGGEKEEKRGKSITETLMELNPMNERENQFASFKGESNLKGATAGGFRGKMKRPAQ